MLTKSIRVFKTREHLKKEPVQTPGMERYELASEPGHWVGRVYTAPGTASGWHHHGEHDSYIYVASGRLRFESGHSGKDAVEAGPGDVVHVPKGVVHRELTSGDSGATLFIVRVGAGEVSVNTDGPEG